MRETPRELNARDYIRYICRRNGLERAKRFASSVANFAKHKAYFIYPSAIRPDKFFMILSRLPDSFRLRFFGGALSLAMLIFGLLGTAVAQQPEDTLVTNTSLVQLNVGVVDRQGHAITTLSQNDFTVYEDGVRRPIAVFEPSQAPFSLVMLLDTSGSTMAFRQQIEQAALRFLDALAPGDRVSVV